MSIVRRFIITYTLRGTMKVDIGIDNDETRAETYAAELAEEALPFVTLHYPGVVEFSPGIATAEEVEEAQ